MRYTRVSSARGAYFASGSIGWHSPLNSQVARSVAVVVVGGLHECRAQLQCLGASLAPRAFSLALPLSSQLVLGKGHDKGVDYWALGILLYEMVAGHSPFADSVNKDQMVICFNILKGDVEFLPISRTGPEGSHLEVRALSASDCGVVMVLLLLLANCYPYSERWNCCSSLTT